MTSVFMKLQGTAGHSGGLAWLVGLKDSHIWNPLGSIFLFHAVIL